MRSAALVGVAILSLVQTGCLSIWGTFEGGGDCIYAGTRGYIYGTGRCIKGDPKVRETCWMAMLFLDFPLCLAADTVLLPYTVPKTVEFKRREAEFERDFEKGAQAIEECAKGWNTSCDDNQDPEAQSPGNPPDE